MSVLVLCGISSVFAQNANPQIEQARQFQITPPEIKDAEMPKDEFSKFDDAPASPGDGDLGEQQILKEKEKEHPFSVFADFSGFHTDNVMLTKTGRSNDAFYVATAGAGYQHKILPELFADVSGRFQMFRYDQFRTMDFDSISGGPGITYVAQKLWDTAFFARYTYTRLTYANDLNSATGGWSGTEFYKNHDLTFGLQKVFQLSKAHYIYVGHSDKIGMTDWQEATGLDPQRNEYALFAGYSAAVSRWFDTSVSYRIGLNDYPMQGNREDINQNISLGFTVKFNEWVSLNGSVAWSLNNSNWPLNDYEGRSVGGGLSANMKF